MPTCADTLWPVTTRHRWTLQGVCTSWLAALRPGEARVPVWTQAGVLRLPADPAVPLLLIGPGTGIAPFRSFVQDRQADIAAGQRCRHPSCRPVANSDPRSRIDLQYPFTAFLPRRWAIEVDQILATAVPSVKRAPGADLP
jgi:hypothetical protein